MAAKELVDHVKLVKAQASTYIGFLGSHIILDTDFAGADNMNPDSGSKNADPTMTFIQSVLDDIFEPDQFTEAEWADIEAAVSTIKNAVSANVRKLQKLVNASVG